MKKRLSVLLFLVMLFTGVSGNALANLSSYSYPYDISQLEWQLLNWTTAWRGTATPVSPFILERMECDRKGWKVIIYVNGMFSQATDENLKGSIDNITSTFKNRFPEFDPKTDLTVYYNLGSSTMVYKDGNFSSVGSSSQEAGY